MEINGVITAGLHVFTVGKSINPQKFGAPASKHFIWDVLLVAQQAQVFVK
jgi:hypothetical protein